MTRRVAQDFEDTVTVDSNPAGRGSSIYQKSIPLAPGRYRLNLAIKDVVGGAANNFELALDVPRLEAGKLASSSLVLADVLERTPRAAG
jgi:hypothetical protein